jgi:hypothetical protein
VIPLIYDNAYRFCQELARLKLNERWLKINKNNEIVEEN